MRELVIAGTGIATLPEVTVRSEVTRGRRVQVLPQWQTELLGVQAVWLTPVRVPGSHDGSSTSWAAEWPRSSRRRAQQKDTNDPERAHRRQIPT